MLSGLIGKVERAAVIILIVVTILVFLPVFGHDFVTWDDTHNVARNPDMQAPSWERVKWYWNPKNAYGDLYIPLTYTVWAAVASVARIAGDAPGSWLLNPAIFHAVNSLLHLASAIVVFAILRRLFGTVWPALLGALFFAVHPVQVEPVAWVSGMKDVLSGLLALLAVLCYILFAQQRKLFWHVLATVCFVMAMLAKPSAVIVPLVVMLIDIVILRRKLRDALVGPMLWLLLAIPVIVLGMMVQKAENVAFVPPIWARPMVALDALGFYFLKLIAPIKLAIDYGRSPLWLFSSWQIWVTWIIPAGLLVVAIVLIKRWQLFTIAVGLAVMAISLVPVLGLVPFDFQGYSTTADHYLYFAMLGPAIIVAGVAARWARRAVILGLVIWIGILGVRSYAQSLVWRDSRTLFENTVEDNPTSLAGLVNLGRFYLEEAERLAMMPNNEAAKAAFAKSFDLYQRAVKLWPSDFQARQGLGNLYKIQRRYGAAEGQYRAALRINPQSAEVHTLLGTVLANQDKLDESIVEFERALKLDANDANAKRLLAQARAKKQAGATTRPSN